MENQRQRSDLRVVWCSVFIFVWMARGEITTKAEPIDPTTGVWKSYKDAFLKFEDFSGDDLSAVLFLKSKGFFNLTGTKAPASENGTFYLNTVQSSYVVGIVGQFLVCNNGMEQLQIALQISASTNCDFDVFSRNSVHNFFRAEESVWFQLEPECPPEESYNDYNDDGEIIANTSQEENCTLSGFWINEYNSTMDLTVDDTRKITGIYQTNHERAEGTSGGGTTNLQGWKGDNSLFTFSMIWNRGTSVASFLGVSRYIDDGMCVLWTDFALIVAQDTCADSWKCCILGSYSTWKKLW